MPFTNGKGTALVEFCIILPILLIMGFAIVDFGLLIQARLIVTNVAREGGDLAARTDTTSASEGTLMTMLQSSATPLVLSGPLGKICITNIVAGTAANPAPSISTTTPPLCAGGLGVGSGVTGPSLGLTQAVYNLLVYNPSNKAPDISGVTVVEVFYEYNPITPLPQLIQGIFSSNGSGMVISSRSVFCTPPNNGN